MLGPTKKDTWSMHRDSNLLLEDHWFWRGNIVEEQHLQNLRRTLRLDDREYGDTYHWQPIDVWSWHTQVVLFCGVWRTRDQHGCINSAFDCTYLSVPASSLTVVGREDLVLLEALDHPTQLPAWPLHPLEHGVAPLWWRMNKDLQWAGKFVDLITRRSNRTQWEELGLADELRARIPMFARAWDQMALPESTQFVVPVELPVPTWAQPEIDDE